MKRAAAAGTVTVAAIALLAVVLLDNDSERARVAEPKRCAVTALAPSFG